MSWPSDTKKKENPEMSPSQILVSYNICITASTWGKWGGEGDHGVLFIMLTMLPCILPLPSFGHDPEIHLPPPSWRIFQSFKCIWERQKVRREEAHGKLSVRNHRCILLWSNVFTDSKQLGCFCSSGKVLVEQEWKHQRHADHIYS